MRYTEPHECYDIAKVGQKLTIGRGTHPIPGTGDCDLLYGFGNENRKFVYVPHNSILIKDDDKQRMTLNLKKGELYEYAGCGGEPSFFISQGDLSFESKYDNIKGRMVILVYEFAYDPRDLEFIVESIPEEGIDEFKERVKDIEEYRQKLKLDQKELALI